MASKGSTWPQRELSSRHRRVEALCGFPSEAGGDIWEVADIEGDAREGAGKSVINVVYDDPPEGA
jgi:hypothetical protein